MSSNFEPIDSLDITRKSTKYFTVTINEVELKAEGIYTGSKDGEYITIKTLTGGTVAMMVPYSVINYYDTTDPSKNLTNPQNADEMMSHLLEEGFFLSNSYDGGGGSGGAETLKSLLDVFINSFAGRAGQALVIDDNEQYVVTRQILNSIFGAIDFIGSKAPGRLLITSQQVNENDESIGVTTADEINFINRPSGFGEIQVLEKGYVWLDVNNIEENTEPYTMQVGDTVKRWFILPPDADYPTMRVLLMERGRWNGGDEWDPESYTHLGLKSFAFPTDPDYQS